MSNYQIAVVVGSLRKESFNRKLADAVVRLAPSGFSFERLEIGDLPLYNQDDDSHPHPNVRRLKSEVSAAHGYLFVTPEYNRSVPGVLKNAIDHASRPYGQNSWAGKPAGIIGCSLGSAGSALAQQHLRNILVYVDVMALAQPEVFIQVTEGMFDTGGSLGNASTRQFLQGWMDRYVAWVRKQAPASAGG